MTASITVPLPQSPIAVAISGGADSLYTLLALKEQGANLMAVHGLFGQRVLARFMRQAGLPLPSPSFEELTEHMQVLCDKLDVPFHLLDCEAIFLQEVIEPFVNTYIEGGTPNPCALCNAKVKLGDLLRQCLLLGATHLATGHYAQCIQSPSGPILLQGSDPKKDQSYFLALTPAEQLSKLIFPMGKRRKKDILDELAAQNITPPQRGESQEICFIPGNLYRQFLPFMASELGLSLPKGGTIRLEDDTRLGTHEGLWQYTEGQRKGIGIGWKEPLHVLAKEQEGNILRVGPKNALRTTGFICGTTNLLIEPSQWPEVVQVKARYREAPRPARVSFETLPGDQMAPQAAKTTMRVRYEDTNTTVSCGQLAVVYIPHGEHNDKLCVAAGGIITASHH